MTDGTQMDELVEIAQNVRARLPVPSADDKHLSLSQAIKLAVEAVQEKGYEYVYKAPGGGQTCYNWHEETDSPGCIVGNILHRFGVHKILLGNSNAASDFLRFYSSADVSVFLCDLQHRQDNGANWGRALTIALNDVGSNGA